MSKRFPEGFLWGAATSSYQIEGATNVGGRGPCIWDTFAATPGKVKNADNGDVACDHYHRYPEDIELMRGLGLRAYRFSTAWPRVFPTGTESSPLEAGLDFYDRLVDALLAANIEPWTTLYHWDLPQGLEDVGGWTNRDTAHRFVDFTAAMAARLGDRVSHWITHNEPWCAAYLGYGSGLHAPGRQSWPDALSASHHLLLSHGLAVPVIRELVPGADVGITFNVAPTEPASPSEHDAVACRQFDGEFQRWYIDPVYGRGYPEDVVAHHIAQGHAPESGLPFVQDGDMDTIAAPVDFIGINYYSRAVVRSAAVPEEDNAPRTIPEPAKEDCTDIGWEVHPDGLRRMIHRLADEYPVGRIYVTENGAAYHQGPDADGVVRDHKRVEYLRGHLRAAAQSIEEGSPLAGYFVWSLLDNFEWHDGYEQRFGVVWVDYETLERTPKDSARFYASVVKANRVD